MATTTPSAIPGTWETTLTPPIFARQRSITAPQVSPDGRRLAFQAEFDGRNDLFVLDRDAAAWPVQVTAAQSLPTHGTHYAWSPDGTRFVIAATDGHLWLCPASGGPAQRLTRTEGRHRAARFSPDGRLISLLCDRGDTVEVVVVAGDGSWQRIVSRGPEFPMDPSWSPDGTRLVWHAYPWNCMPWDESALVVADVDGGAPRVIAAGSRVAYANARFSPDGARLVCLCDRGGALNVTEMAADGTDQRTLHEDRWEHGEPSYAPDGHTIVYTRNVAGDYQLWTVPSGGGAPRQLTETPGHAVAPSWAPDSQRLVYAFDSPTTPSDVWEVDLASGRRRQVTHSTMGGITAGDLVMPEHVTWTSPDGFEVHGLLFVPKTVRPGQHGCLVNIHGGPMNQSRVIWDGMVQYLVQRGWVVIHSNYRGSLGFGRAYREALFGSWGEGDLADNIGAIDYAARRGFVRRDRAVAWGGSAGGYSTLVCVTAAPERFAGGVALYGLYDLYTFGLETHRYERYYVETILGPSGERYPLWHERAPINHLDQIRVPLLIAQGADDRVVWPAQSETVNRELDRLGVDYEYVCYPGEGHGFRKVASQVDFALRMDRYLCQKVLRAPEPGPLGILPYPPMPVRDGRP
jgi:dipeptidyl aminopeptidase/acylaminoacyl peptidase